MKSTALVVGLGNALMADDGVGLEVARRLAACPRGIGARVEVAGADSLVLPSLWRGEDRVWLVDALERGGEPGTLHILEHDELLCLPQVHRGAHHLSLPECLRWVGVAHPEMAEVRYTLWGVEPGVIEPSEGLSPEVEAAAAEVVELISTALLA